MQDKIRKILAVIVTFLKKVWQGIGKYAGQPKERPSRQLEFVRRVDAAGKRHCQWRNFDSAPPKRRIVFKTRILVVCVDKHADAPSPQEYGHSIDGNMGHVPPAFLAVARLRFFVRM